MPSIVAGLVTDEQEDFLDHETTKSTKERIINHEFHEFRRIILNQVTEDREKYREFFDRIYRIYKISSLII